VGKNERAAIPRRATTPGAEAALAVAFVAYILLLLLFAGLIALPAHQANGTGATGPASPPPPPAILVQTPPVWFVHSASLAYGFALAVAIVLAAVRRYGPLVPSGE
jgi:hypothetical protein